MIGAENHLVPGDGHRPHYGAVVDHEGDVYRPISPTLTELARPVEGVDDPDSATQQAVAAVDRLLRQYRVLGMSLVETAHDELVRSSVTLGGDRRGVGSGCLEVRSQLEERLAGLLGDARGIHVISLHRHRGEAS